MARLRQFLGHDPAAGTSPNDDRVDRCKCHEGSPLLG